MWCVFFIVGLSGCATTRPFPPTSAAPPQAIPLLQGSYYRVQPGETLWRVAKTFGLSPNLLASVNHLPNTRQLHTGQQLFIPLPPESRQFFWPVRGRCLSMPSKGVALVAPEGTFVRATRGGQVAVAATTLSGWSHTVVVDHLDGYLSVYAGMDQLLVTPGLTIRQGTPVGRVGDTPIYFEIRYGVQTRDCMALLPQSE